MLRKKASETNKWLKKNKTNTFAKCKLCSNEYKTCNNTSNMLAHLKRSHPETLKNEDSESERSSESENQNDEIICEGTSSSLTPTPIIEPVGTKKVKQAKISRIFDKKTCYTKDSEKKKKLDITLTLMIATDFQPFDVVNDVGFIKFVNLLDPRYKIPCSQTIRNKIMPDLYEKAKLTLQNILEKVEWVALTTDIWTSSNIEAYITVTCHFVYKNFLKTAILNIICMPGTHTAIDIQNAISEILSRWNLKNKVSAIVTDNASVMSLACSYLKIRNQPCLAHTINLVVTDAPKEIEKLSEVLSKCKNIVRHFQHSTVAASRLKYELEKSGKKNLKLIQETATRWNSLLLMLERILEMEDCLILTISKLSNPPQQLFADDIMITKDCVRILKCFNEATTIISGESYVSSSLIIPVIFGLYNALELVEPDIVTDEGKIFFKNIMESISKRLVPFEQRTIPKFSTILDPRFKKFGFRSSNNANQAQEYLQNELSHYIKNKSELQNIQSSPIIDENKKNSGKTNFFNFLEKQIASKNKSSTPMCDAILLLRQYLEMLAVEHQENIIHFWNSQKMLHPLNDFAFRYLCVPATSVPSERVFSAAGYIISDRRSRLKPDILDILVFLNRNQWILELEE